MSMCEKVCGVRALSPRNPHIRVSAGSDSGPIYRQIAEQIRRAVKDQSLRPSDRLPSVRALAQQLVINPNTVARAYGDLSREGVIEARPGRGVFMLDWRGAALNEAGVAPNTMTGTLVSIIAGPAATTAALQLPPLIMNTLSL